MLIIALLRYFYGRACCFNDRILSLSSRQMDISYV